MSGKHNRALLVSLLVLISGGMTLSKSQAAVKDSDADGLTDQAEISTYHTDPHNSDTDGDGFSDSEEVLAGSDPLRADSVPALETAPPDVETPLPWKTSWLSGIGSIVLLALISVISVLREQNRQLNYQTLASAKKEAV